MDSAWWMLLSAASRIFLKGSGVQLGRGVEFVWRDSWNMGGDREVAGRRLGGEKSTWFCTR